MRYAGHLRTSGTYGAGHRKAGRPVRIFARIGRAWAHLEIGPHAFHTWRG